MATITKSLTIESQGTYNLTFDLWSYSEWAASAGITTSYASLAALIADEKAVRQLMTVHASVDFFANCTDPTIISTVINNDLCAKWINLRDYALDTLSAKNNIKSVMDTADKYGYGEWGIVDSTTTPPTWGPLGNVPIMTSNTAPYGVASAYQVFDGNASTSASGTDFSYQSVNPICVKRYKATGAGGANITGTIQGSNDGSTWTDITLASNTTYYMYHRLHLASSTAVYTLQFYGRELKPLVPNMTANDKPKGEVLASGYEGTQHCPYYAFDGNDSTDWDNETGASAGSSYIGYKSNTKTRIAAILVYAVKRNIEYAVEGSDGTEWTSIGTGSSTKYVKSYSMVDSTEAYTEHRIRITNYTDFTMITVQFYGFDYSEKEFASGSTAKWIYDHGVKPSGAITGGTDDGNNLTLSAVGTATITIDKGTCKYMGGKVGLHASGTNRLKCGSGYSNFTASPYNMPDSNGFDISSISGSVAVGIEQTARGTFDCTEIWIE